MIEAAENFNRAYWTDYELSRSLKPSSNDDKKHSESHRSSETKHTSESKKKKRNHVSSGNQSNSGPSSESRHKSSNQSAATGSGSSEPAYKKLLGSNGKLLPKERERRIANNLCLLCGQKGHNSDSCPKKKKSDQPTSSLARATITLTPPAAPATGTDPNSR